MHDVYYASMTLDEAQVNYVTTEKETLILVFPICNYRSYFIGSKIIMNTNHIVIKYLISKKDFKPMLEHSLILSSKEFWW